MKAVDRIAQTLLQLTVKDILKRPLFQHAEAYASEKALSRTVRWAHIMEVTEVGRLLNGHELILSTGIGWQNDEERSVSFLRQLIDSGASGLCVELGAYAKAPLRSMLDLAEREHFPLIFFREQVRYIDITQDLHAYFINQHHWMVAQLEAFSTKLNQLLLSGKGMMALLRVLHETTGAQVAFFPTSGDSLFLPAMAADKADALYEQWVYGSLFEASGTSGRLAHRPILALDQLFADLLLQNEEGLSEYHVLALDRCATAIAQEMMRTKYIEERRRRQDDAWIAEWLTGKHPEAEIRRYISAMKPGLKLERVVVCALELSAALHAHKNIETLLIQKNMVARSVFERSGFYIIPTIVSGRLILAALDQTAGTAWQERIHKALQRLIETEKRQETELFSTALVGVGKYMHSLAGVTESYRSALETISIQEDVGRLEAPFYSELHAYKIISAMKATGMLPSLIDEYIGPVIAYDQEKNGQLLLTLKQFLALSGSKQETAKVLFVVRQTLYHRLDKIEALLGADYMSPDKRFAIELALHAYEYIYGAIR